MNLYDLAALDLSHSSASFIILRLRQWNTEVILREMLLDNPFPTILLEKWNWSRKAFEKNIDLLSCKGDSDFI